MNRNIIIADNHELSRYAIQQLITNNNLSVGKETLCVSSTNELNATLDKDDTAMVIVDMGHFDSIHTEDLVALHSKHANTAWLILSADLSEATVRRLSEWSSFSFALTNCRVEEILSAIKSSIVGERFICHQVMDILLSPNKREETEQLTSTEIEVLRLIAQGRTVKEIAGIRNSSSHTIIAHKRNIFRKLNVNTIYEATMAAARMGLVNLIEYYI